MGKDIINKTTNKDFELFKKNVNHWVKFFGLNNWKIYLVHEDTQKELDAGAWCSWNVEGRAATIGLSIDWGNHTIPTPYEIKRMAFHEVCEMMLAPMNDLAASRLWDQYSYDSEKHNVIRILENTVWKP